MKFYLFLRIRKFVVLVVLVMTTGQFIYAQAWMPGYNFRKKITIDKSKVPATSNLQNFPVLIELVTADLKNISECGGDPQHSGGLPISFALYNQPTLPLRFQMDSYEPGSGKLRCWVQIPDLISANHPGTNEIYFYYGGNDRHDPLAPESRAVWSDSYRQVWHMNLDGEPAISFSANHSYGNNALGNSEMNAGSFVQGIIGSGIRFNGLTDGMRSVADKERATCISVWIRLAQIGAEQVILANDSAANGYQLKINAEGKVIFDILNMGIVNRHTSIVAVPVNTWTYLTASFVNNQKKIYINGDYKGGGGSTSTVGIGETLSIGRSKLNDKYFNGEMDELRIANVERSAGWLLTEYLNQLNPGSFINVAPSEVNPVQVSNAIEFTGANGTNDWYDERNWSSGQLPGIHTDVVIPTGKEVHLNDGNAVSLNRLFLRAGAAMILRGNLEVNCSAHLAASSSIYLKDNARLIFKKDLLIDGTIFSDQQNETLSFKGGDPLQVVSGTGTITIAQLEVNLALPLHTLWLNAPINISGRLVLLKGILDANDQLTLLAGGYNKHAALAPVEDVLHTGVIGNVNIEQFIDGSFSSPSTARGWKLMSSPVFHSVSSTKAYNLQAVQQSIFVTGPGGAMNGFDPSPNNNSTIYTHNQALSGTLSQKYTGIPRMDVSIPLGKGIFVFSRGSRMVQNAYEHQVQKPPFSSPEPYVLTHTGQLFTGDLKIDLFNNNTGAEGDGYNLIGNPYASAIIWGGLQKTNVSSFVWVFDPENSAYFVTDQPGYVIPAGTGFFVKVNNGVSTGSLTFTESAKHATVPTALRKLASAQTQWESNGNLPSTKIKVGLKKDGLSDEYVLILQKGSDDGVTDADAQKIGEGYLSISGLTANEQKLAIDERGADSAISTIRLFVKGWASGVYTLNLQMNLNNKEQVILVDHYLNQQIPVELNNYQYSFLIDIENSESYGKHRFSLRIGALEKAIPVNEKANGAILFYPNPVNELIYLKSTVQTWRNLKVIVRGIAGNVIWKGELPLLEAGIPVSMPCDQLIRGLYLFQFSDEKTNKTIASFKVLKN